MIKNKIVFVADIADDIDDLIAIEYLVVNGYLKCLVLDGKSRDTNREIALNLLNVNIVDEIPIGTKIIFCGGALTKVANFILNNEIDLLVANGGFAGINVVPIEDILTKFEGKKKIRTYNFNMDVPATLRTLTSTKIKKIILVSKNVCHSKINTKGYLHMDSFLNKYDLSDKKCLHDLLMVKEGINYLNGNIMLCNYEKITPTLDRKDVDNMSLWGSDFDPTSNIEISINYK